jgi:hypothetical protein
MFIFFCRAFLFILVFMIYQGYSHDHDQTPGPSSNFAVGLRMTRADVTGLRQLPAVNEEAQQLLGGAMPRQQNRCCFATGCLSAANAYVIFPFLALANCSLSTTYLTTGVASSASTVSTGCALGTTVTVGFCALCQMACTCVPCCLNYCACPEARQDFRDGQDYGGECINA